MLKLRLNKNNLIIVYKLLNDSFFIAILFLFFAMISDGLVPGIVSSHLSFSRIILFTALNLLGIYYLARFTDINLRKNQINKKIALLAIFILMLLIFNSLFKLSILLNLFITALTGFSGYLIYKVILDERES